MSTILKALQRVEGEKGGGDEQGGLREGLVPLGEPLVRESARARWRVGITGFAAALLIGFFLWWSIPASEVSQPLAEPQPVAAAPPERSLEPSPQPGRQDLPRREAEATAARPAAPSEVLPLPPPAEPVAMAPPLPPVEESAPGDWLAGAPIAVPVEVPAARERLAEAPLAPPAEPSTPAPAPVVETQPRVKKTQERQAPAPALVATVRPPSVTVRSTRWHPTPERRLARIEVQGHKGVLELREGDAVGTLVVAEIQPSAVVFLHGGEKLRRKVGTSR